MHVYCQNHRYRTIINAVVLSSIGDSLYNIVFIIYASQMPFQSLAVSLASMASLVPVLLSVLTGYLADQTRSKVAWMIVARMVQAALFGGLAFAITLPHSMPLFLLLFAINIVSDTIGNFSDGLAIPLYKRVLQQKDLTVAFGFNTAATSTIQMIFQAVGASIIVLLHHNYALFGCINAITFVLSAGVLLRQRQKLPHRRPYAVKDGDNIKVPLHQALVNIVQLLRYNHFLLAIILLAIPTNILASSTTALIDVTLLHTQQLWLGNYGTTVAIVNIVFAGGMVLGSLFMSDGLHRLRILHVFAIAVTGLIALGGSLIWQQHILLVLGCLLCTGYTISKLNPRINTITVTQVPEAQLAAMNGVDTTASLIGVPVGQAGLLAVANLVNTQLAWTIYACFGAALLLVILFAAHRLIEPIIQVTN